MWVRAIFRIEAEHAGSAGHMGLVLKPEVLRALVRVRGVAVVVEQQVLRYCTSRGEVGYICGGVNGDLLFHGRLVW